jgi:hypothetical protein
MLEADLESRVATARRDTLACLLPAAASALVATLEPSVGDVLPLEWSAPPGCPGEAEVRTPRGGVWEGIGVVGRRWRFDLAGEYWGQWRLQPFAATPSFSRSARSAAPAGDTSAYVELAAATGGVFEPLGNFNVGELFDQRLDRIQEVALSCEYEIPTPPEGQVFDKGRVNVDYDDGFGLQTIGYVDSASECAGVGNGWYYDDVDAPTAILMCPQTCGRFKAADEASIELRFGCATVPAG